MGGFLAFPGGKATAGDADPQLVPEGAVGGDPPVKPERWVTAARELFEETGVLIARRPDGHFCCMCSRFAANRGGNPAEIRGSLADALGPGAANAPLITRVFARSFR